MAFVKISEQSSLYNDLEKKSVHEILEDINTEDHKVADAVKLAIPQIEKLVTGIVKRMKKLAVSSISVPELPDVSACSTLLRFRLHSVWIRDGLSAYRRWRHCAPQPGGER